MKSRIIFITLALILIDCVQAEEWIHPDFAEAITRIKTSYDPGGFFSRPNHTFAKRVDEWGNPGISLALSYDNEIIWLMTYGVADEETTTAIERSTQFQAASISKSFTAARVLQLVEAEVLDLDEDINNYLSSWKLLERSGFEEEGITIRDILSHRAGLSPRDFIGYAQGETIPSLPDILDGRGNSPRVEISTRPGIDYRYSGGGYIVLQQIIEDVTHQDFADSMEEHVLSPLGMNSSTFSLLNPTNDSRQAIASGYTSEDGPIEGKWRNFPEAAPAGLWSTPTDLLKYASEIQNILQTKQDGILSYETVVQMLTPRSNEGYGFGHSVGEYTFSHTGRNPGYISLMIAGLESPLALAVMTNSSNPRVWRETWRSVDREFQVTKE